MLGRWREAPWWYLAQGHMRQPWPSQVTAWVRQARHLTLEMGSYTPCIPQSHPPLWEVSPPTPPGRCRSMLKASREETYFRGEQRSGLFCPTAVLISLPVIYFYPIREGLSAEDCSRRLKSSLTTWTRKIQINVPISIFFSNMAPGSHSLQLYPWILFGNSHFHIHLFLDNWRSITTFLLAITSATK